MLKANPKPYLGSTTPEKSGNIPPEHWRAALDHLRDNRHGYVSAVSIAEALWGRCQPVTNRDNAEAILFRLVAECRVDGTDTPTVWKPSKVQP